MDERKLVVLFFVALFVGGLSVYDDYGISWDEEYQHKVGVYSMDYVLNGDQTLFTDINVTRGSYGPAFQLFMVSVERLLGLRDSRSVYLMRHLCTFLMFYAGVFFFYLLCLRHFNSRLIALAGSLFLIISPRIFADSFYNPKDIPFMAMFIITMYTLQEYRKKRTLLWTGLHALACALLIDIRVAGVLAPLITFIVIYVDFFMTSHGESRIKFLKNLAAYAIILVPSTILFWPFLWPNPIVNFAISVTTMAGYLWPSSVLYFGASINPASESLPWHYIPVWVAITTPLLYTMLFFIGIALFTADLLKNPVWFYRRHSDDIMFALWLFLPIAIAIELKTAVYDGWRHLFFIYPAFIVFSLEGLRFLLDSVNKRFKGFARTLLHSLVLFLVAAGVLSTAWWMAVNHPFENVYFNSMAGGSMGEVKDNFDMDYWGLSFRQALEYVVGSEKTGNIKIYVEHNPGPGVSNANMLAIEDRERISYVDDIYDADYFLSNFRWHKEDYFPENEGWVSQGGIEAKKVYSIKTGDAEIMVVYKIRKSPLGAAPEPRQV
jgi:hypothetical protein